MDKEQRNIVMFCPECGPLKNVDEDGLCQNCGAAATGKQLDILFLKMHQIVNTLKSARHSLTIPHGQLEHDKVIEKIDEALKQ